MKIAAPGSLCPRFSWGFFAVLAASAGLCSASCEPGVATPVPEPPTLNLARVGPPAMESTAQPLNGVHIYGLSGAAPSGALVRVTNLDGTDPPSTVNVQPDGSFDVVVNVTSGQELRFDWLRGAERGEPQDARFITMPSPFHLEPSQRFDCVKLTPGFSVDFGLALTQTLLVENECASSITLAAPRARLGLPDFALETALPIDIEPGLETTLGLTFTRAQTTAREDTLFFDVTRDGVAIRYPITLLAPAAP